MRGTSLASLDAAQDRFEPVADRRGQAGDRRSASSCSPSSTPWTPRARCGGPCPTLPSTATPRPGSWPQRARPARRPRRRRPSRTSCRSRWSSDDDLVDAVEQLGFDAVLASARGRQGSSSRSRTSCSASRGRSSASARCAQALFDPRVPGDKRARPRRQPARAARSPTRPSRWHGGRPRRPRGRRFVATLGHVAELAAARRDRLVASVTSGSELSQAQLDRLGAILQQAYGQDLQLNVTVDPEILGGLRIQVGADVVDSTVLARLADARRRLAS